MGQGKEGRRKLKKENNKWSKFPEEARRKGRNPEAGECGVHVG